MELFKHLPDHRGCDYCGHKEVLLIGEFAPRQFEAQCPKCGKAARVVIFAVYSRVASEALTSS
jgi:hypothetical protein